MAVLRMSTEELSRLDTLMRVEREELLRNLMMEG